MSGPYKKCETCEGPGVRCTRCPLDDDGVSCETHTIEWTPDKPEPRYTVAEIREYLEGALMPEPFEAQNGSLRNVLTELEDEEDGIAAVVERMKAEGKAVRGE